MVNYTIGKDRPENWPEFLIWRARAIDAYAGVEQSLNMLFAHLLGTTPDISGIVFFRLTNTHSRNRILEELLQKRHGDEYAVYWHGIPETKNRRGLMNLINGLDQKRNEIVHWHTINNLSREGDKVISTLVLGKPNFWSGDITDITVSNMEEFVAKADFIDRSLVMFRSVANNELRDDSPAKQTWHDICQQPCVYPPPDNHPLSQKHTAPETPPQSSQA